MKITWTIFGSVLSSIAGAAVVVACSSKSNGADAREVVCGNDPSGTTCTCTWQVPSGGATQTSCSTQDPRGACCQSKDWKTADNSTCACIPPDDVNCYYNGNTSICKCLIEPTAPSGFLPIAECDAPFPGHCCKDLPDAGANPVCECSVSACTKSQAEIANCAPSMDNASCGNDLTQVDSCK